MFSPMFLLLTALASFNPGLGQSDEPKKEPKASAGKTVQPEVADITGYYSCKGQEAGGKSYTGIAVIIKKNDIYLVQWMVGGGSTFSGVGIRQGDTLSASWAMASDRGVVRGVNVYRIEAGPRLVGRWASLPGPGVQQNESLIFLKKLDMEE